MSQTKFSRLVLLSIFLLLACAPMATAQKKDKNKEAPTGTPVLWREPLGIESRSLLLGAGGEEMKPDLSKVTFLEEEKGGYSTKYRV